MKKTIEMNISAFVETILDIDEQNQLICADFAFENSSLAMNFSMILGEMLKNFNTGTASFDNNSWHLVIETANDWDNAVYQIIKAINFFNKIEMETKLTKAN